MGFKGPVAGLLALMALAVAWIAPVAAQAQGAEQVPSLEADRSNNAQADGDEGEPDAPADAEEPVGQAAQDDDEDRDCADFSSQEEAQEFFEDQGGPEEDPNRLDANDDGEACEDFFSDTDVPQDDEGDRDCADFSSQEEAQEFFEDQGGPEEDPNRLDANDDGEACEDFFSDTGVPRGGGRRGRGRG